MTNALKLGQIFYIYEITQIALLFHFWGRVGFVTHVCLLMKFFGGAWYPMGFPDRGSFDLNLVGTLNIM